MTTASTSVGIAPALLSDGSLGLQTVPTANGQQVSPTNPLPTRFVGGIGPIGPIPSPTANGTPLGVPPNGTIGVRLYLGSADSVTFTIALGQPAGVPAETVTIAGSNTPYWDENLSGSAMIYVTAAAGAPKFRWY